MKNKITLLTFCLLFLFNSITPVKGEIANHLFSSKSVSFRGVDNNWEIIHEMTLVGTDILFQTSIKYKGKYDKDLVKSNSRYLIIYRNGTIGGETFLLNQSGEFHGKKRECGGCEFIDKEKELYYEIYWKDNISRVILNRVDKPISL
ncbi:hypothetical protein [Gottfriedia acidiceleris]|uniref:hypothetical protein n=1 Tax=Gottfriedia acidiceleris TaxID=371036 RepID=UPI000B43E933|nr:hypothetical protein [Gottfriedia acidiceleris]